MSSAQSSVPANSLLEVSASRPRYVAPLLALTLVIALGLVSGVFLQVVQFGGTLSILGGPSNDGFPTHRLEESVVPASMRTNAPAVTAPDCPERSPPVPSPPFPLSVWPTVASLDQAAEQPSMVIEVAATKPDFVNFFFVEHFICRGA